MCAFERIYMHLAWLLRETVGLWSLIPHHSHRNRAKTALFALGDVSSTSQELLKGYFGQKKLKIG